MLYSGHTIDTEEAVSPRVPVNCEARARSFIEQALVDLQKMLDEDTKLTVLASAAPGADILLLEACVGLGITTHLCLPVSSETIAKTAFPQADQWRTRFFNVLKIHEGRVLQMAETDDLPKWLRGRESIDMWERGNRWVMQKAEIWGVDRVTVLALWDGKNDERKGGTAHFVRMAQVNGYFELKVIDSNLLIS